MKFFLWLCVLVSSVQAFAIDHDYAAFTELLGKYTVQKNGQTWVRYGDLKKSGSGTLNEVLRNLSGVSQKEYQGFTNDQKLAFLINAYNAFTLEWILMHYPVKSIKDTGSLLSSPWKKTIPGYSLLGKEFTLDQIEHEMIRKNFREPRIHFAVNCASIGCPSLMPRAFTGSNLNAELAQAEEAFFRNPGKFRREKNTVFVSPILDWYGKDFEKVHGSLKTYLSDRMKAYGLGNLKASDLDVEFLDYDWNLNGE